MKLGHHFPDTFINLWLNPAKHVAKYQGKFTELENAICRKSLTTIWWLQLFLPSLKTYIQFTSQSVTEITTVLKKQTHIKNPTKRIYAVMAEYSNIILVHVWWNCSTDINLIRVFLLWIWNMLNLPDLITNTWKAAMHHTADDNYYHSVSIIVQNRYVIR